LPEFTGLKMCWAGNLLSGFPDIRRIEIDKFVDRLLFDEIGKIGSGGNSGFQALNLAVQFGARRIILIGFDMTDRGGVHWYGRNNWMMANNPDATNFNRWIAYFATAADQLRSMGIDVVNASPTSVLKAFPRRSIADAMKEWAA